MTATLLLALLMAIGFAATFSRHGSTSLVTLGVIGFFAYSLPSLLDLHLPFAISKSRPVWVATPPETDWAVVVAWAVLVPILAFRRTKNWQSSAKPTDTELVLLNDYALVGTAIIIAGHLWLSWSD